MTTNETKTAAEQKLDAVIDRLKNDGRIAAYSLARYDAGENGKDARFSTRVSYPDGVDPDYAYESLILYKPERRAQPAGASLEIELVKVAQELCDQDGWSVFIVVAPLRDQDGYRVREWAVYPYASTSHQTLDMLREILNAWSDARH